MRWNIRTEAELPRTSYQSPQDSQTRDRSVHPKARDAHHRKAEQRAEQAEGLIIFKLDKLAIRDRFNLREPCVNLAFLVK